MSCGRLPVHSRLPSHSGRVRFTTAALERKKSPQHLDARDTEAWFAVTVANLKVVKVLAGMWGRVMDSCISLADQGCEDIVEQKIGPEQAGGLIGLDYSPQL